MSTTQSAARGRRNLGIALIVIATAQLMVVLDGSVRVHLRTSAGDRASDQTTWLPTQR